MSDNGGSPATAIVLDYLAHGRSDEGGPAYNQEPVAQALGVEGFRLYELVVESDAGVSIGDELVVRPPEPPVTEFREMTYADLSQGAQSELEYVIDELIEANEARFVDVFNEAQPITLRLHQLNLLPGIGDKLRDQILDARKRGPFDSFDDMAARINGLHDPEGVIRERILSELQEDDVKYSLFVGGPY